MAILKVINGSSTSKGGAKVTLDYVGEKAIEADGWNCSNDYKEAFKDFQETKTMYDKHEGRQCKHYTIAFKEGEIDSKRAMEITRKYVEKRYPGQEVYIGLHNDTGHLHTHLVINSVSIDTGKKIHESSKDLQKNKELLNEICLEYGLEIPSKSQEEGKIVVWEQSKYKGMKKEIEKGEIPDNVGLVREIQATVKESTSKKDFIEKMESKGYSVVWKETNKNVTFTVPKELLKGKKNKFRLSTLKKDFNLKEFTKEGLENEFRQHKRNREERGITQEWLESVGLGASSRDQKNKGRNQHEGKGNDDVDGYDERIHRRAEKGKCRIILPSNKNRGKDRGYER